MSQSQIASGSGGSSSGAGGASSVGGNALYISPVHFSATRYSDTALTLAGVVTGLISDVSQFIAIDVWNSSGGYVGSYTPQTNVFAWDAANNRVTVTGAAFLSGSYFMVKLVAQDRYANDPSNHLLVGEVNPYQLRADDSGLLLITAAQDFTSGWVDLGPEISMFGWNTLKLWLTLDINDGADCRIRVLDKHESAGVEEYSPPIEIISASKISIEPQYWEVNVDADQLLTPVYKTDGVVPFVQVQISAGTPGATPAQIDSARYTRGWR